jgi:hypothetical protein
VQQDLEGAPRYSADQDPAFNRANCEQIDTFYDRDFAAA